MYRWSKPPFFSGMTRLAGSVVFAFGGRAGCAAAGAASRRRGPARAFGGQAGAADGARLCRRPGPGRRGACAGRGGLGRGAALVVRHPGRGLGGPPSAAAAGPRPAAPACRSSPPAPPRPAAGGRLLGVQPGLRLLPAHQLTRGAAPASPAPARARPRRHPPNRASSAASSARAAPASRPPPRRSASPAPRCPPELLRRSVRRHRRVALTFVPSPATTSTRTRPAARTRPATDQQPLHRLLCRVTNRATSRDQGAVPAVHPGAHVIEGGHLDRPRRPDPLAVAVHDQRHHHPRVIRLLALPVGPVPGQETAPGPRPACSSIAHARCPAGSQSRASGGNKNT